MINKYYDCGLVAVAVNFKVASASVARAVIKAHHPVKEETITTAWTQGYTGHCTSYPPNKNADNCRWHGLTPKVNSDNKPVLLLVRDPIEKFRSACAEDGVASVANKLTRLESGDPATWERNLHFWPQARFLDNVGVRAYRFPRDLEQFCTDAGLEYPMSHIGQSGHNGNEKPVLTVAQRNRVKALYADDLVLYDSTAGGIVDVSANAGADPELYRNRKRRG